MTLTETQTGSGAVRGLTGRETPDEIMALFDAGEYEWCWTCYAWQRVRTGHVCAHLTQDPGDESWSGPEKDGAL